MSKNAKTSMRSPSSIHVDNLRAQIIEMVEVSNAQHRPTRRVSIGAAITVANRDLARTVGKPTSVRSYSAMRAVGAHLALATRNRQTASALQNADLLYVGHPASTAGLSLTASAARRASAQWFADDPEVAPELRSLVASAHAAFPGSASREQKFAVLSMTPGLPLYVTVDSEADDDPAFDALIAVAGFGVGGNSRAARSLRARMQRRDRYGRFAEMGGGFSFSLRGLKGLFSTVSGRIVGANPKSETDIEVEVRGDANLPDGIYTVPSTKGMASKAILSRRVLDQLGLRRKNRRGSDSVFIDESELTRADTPSGWRLQSEGDGRRVFVSDDGYFAVETMGGDGQPRLQLHRANLKDNSIGAPVGGEGTSWADIQRSARIDSPSYAPVVDAADALETERTETVTRFVRDQPGGSDDGYDALKDSMLEDGWSKNMPGYRDEIVRRAVKADRESQSEDYVSVSKDVKKRYPALDDSMLRALDWASDPRSKTSDTVKSIVRQSGKGLTRKQWQTLLRAAPKDYDPSGLTDDQKRELEERVAAIVPSPFGFYSLDSGSYEPWRGFDGIKQRNMIDFLRLRAQGQYVPRSMWDSVQRSAGSSELPTQNFVLDGLPRADVDSKMQRLIDEIDRAIDEADRSPADTGLRQARLRDAKKFLARIEEILPKIPSNVDTDLPDLVEAFKADIDAIERGLTIDDDAEPDEVVPVSEAVKDATRPREPNLTEDVDVKEAAQRLASLINSAKLPETLTKDLPFGYRPGLSRGEIFTRWDRRRGEYVDPTYWDNRGEDPDSWDFQDDLVGAIAVDVETGRRGIVVEVGRDALIWWADSQSFTPYIEDTLTEATHGDIDDGGKYLLYRTTPAIAAELDALDKEFSAESKRVRGFVRLMPSEKDVIAKIEDMWSADEASEDTRQLLDEDGNPDPRVRLVLPDGRMVSVADGQNGETLWRLTNVHGDILSEVDASDDRAGGLLFSNAAPTRSAPTADPDLEVPYDTAYRSPEAYVRSVINEMESFATLAANGGFDEDGDIIPEIANDLGIPDGDYPYGAYFDEDGVIRSGTNIQLPDGRSVTVEDVDGETSWVLRDASGNIIKYASVAEDDAGKYLFRGAAPTADPDLLFNDTKFVPVRTPELGEPVDREAAARRIGRLIDDATLDKPVSANDDRYFVGIIDHDNVSPRFIDMREDPDAMRWRHDLVGDAIIVDAETGRRGVVVRSNESSVKVWWADNGAYEPENDNSVEWITPSDVYSGYYDVYPAPPDLKNEVVVTQQEIDAEPSDPAPVSAPAPTPSTPAQSNTSSPSDGPARLRGSSTDELIQELELAIANGETVTFNYGGKPRVFKPERIAVSNRTGLVNVNGDSTSDGGNRTFTVDKIEIIEDEPVSPNLPDAVRPLRSGLIDDVKSQIEDAIFAGEAVTFLYHGKQRTLLPEQVYVSKKGNTNVVGFSFDDDESRTFSIDKMGFLDPDEVALALPEIETYADVFGDGFIVPDGAHRLDVITPYTPTSDVDDPENLANIFSYSELRRALREAVTPRDGQQAPGSADLQFPDERKPVPAEAIYEGLQRYGIDADEILAEIYDDHLPEADRTNAEKVRAFRARQIADFEGGSPLAEQLPLTDADDRSVQRAARGGRAEFRDFGDVSTWEPLDIERSIGTHDGAFFRGPDGEIYYVKRVPSRLHAENEVLAGMFYEELGVQTVRTGLGTVGDASHVVSPMVPGADPDDFGDRIYSGDEEYMGKLRQDFMVDAWIGNYDSVGTLMFQNVVTDENGDPVRIDHGAALLFRARGRLKGAMFGDEVAELEGLRDPDVNPYAARIFGSLSNDELRAQAERIRDIAPSRIDQIVDSAVSSPDAATQIKERLKARRQYLMERFGLSEAGRSDDDLMPKPTSLEGAIGYEAQDLKPGDVLSDGFVVERTFRDLVTPKNGVSVRGYYPGRSSQRKELPATRLLDVARRVDQPAPGPKPALVEPRPPRRPSTGPWTGRMEELLDGVSSWDEVRDVINGTDIIFFDYETTGISTSSGDGELNRPVQLGAVRVRDGVVVDRLNLYMNPEFRLSAWSAGNLRRDDDVPLTDDWLRTQMSMREAHELFLGFAGDSPILGGHNVQFDLEVLQRTLNEQGLSLEVGGTIDSMELASVLPVWSPKNPVGPVMHNGKTGTTRPSRALGPVAEYLGVDLGDGWHSADADAAASWEAVSRMIDRLAGGSAPMNPDADTLLDTQGNRERRRLAEAEYQAEVEVYRDAMRQYAIERAFAAANACDAGGSITAAADPSDGSGPCSFNLDELLRLARGERSSIDPDTIPVGTTPFRDDNGNPCSVTKSPSGEITVQQNCGVSASTPSPDDPYAGEAFPPTEQQRLIVDAVLTGDDTVVRALAGTGKTSTLRLIARRLLREQPDKRIIYVAFNKSIQVEAEGTFPKANTEARTADSLSWQATDKSITGKMSANSRNQDPRQASARFGITAFSYVDDAGETVDVTLRQAVAAAKATVNNFAISADDEIGPQHLPSEDMPQEMVGWARAMWADLNDPKGWLPITNAHITKMWALTRPDLSDVSSGVKRAADVIFFDEAQDINPVLGRVIADQKIQVVYVGDGNQAIYGFRGAQDELQRVEAKHDLPLTKSWRFGRQIAGIGNRFLSLLGSPHRIEGGGRDGIITRSIDKPQAILVRSNGGAVGEIIAELEAGRRVGVSANFKKDLESFIETARWLIDGADPSSRPRSIHPDLAQYSSWKDVLDDVKESDNRKLLVFTDLVEQMGIPQIDDMLNRVQVYQGEVADAVERIEETDVETGKSGTLVRLPGGKSLEYRVVGNKLYISGTGTYDSKEVIKRAGARRFDGPSKSWLADTRSAAERAKILNEIIDALGGDEGGIDVVVMTAHRSKGLEWDRVRVGQDFPRPKKDKETGEYIMPQPEELRLAYVTVTRAKRELDAGALEWVFEHTVDADEDPFAGSSVASDPDVDDILDEPDTPAAEIESSMPPAGDDLDPLVEPPGPQDDNADTPGVPEEPDDESVQELETSDAIERASQFDTMSDEEIIQSIDDIIEDFESSIEFLRGPRRQELTEAYNKAIAIARDFKAGGADRAETMQKLVELVQSLRKYKRNDKALDGYLARRSVESFLQLFMHRPIGEGLPPAESPLGWSKNGVFVVPGMRVRDKWGYAGTVIGYNLSDFNGIFILFDMDSRDPEKTRPDHRYPWGPVSNISAKNVALVHVIQPGDDDSPWIDVGKPNKAPKNIDQQRAMFEERLAAHRARLAAQAEKREIVRRQMDEMLEEFNAEAEASKAAKDARRREAVGRTADDLADAKKDFVGKAAPKSAGQPHGAWSNGQFLLETGSGISRIGPSTLEGMSPGEAMDWLTEELGLTYAEAQQIVRRFLGVNAEYDPDANDGEGGYTITPVGVDTFDYGDDDGGDAGPKVYSDPEDDDGGGGDGGGVTGGGPRWDGDGGGTSVPDNTADQFEVDHQTLRYLVSDGSVSPLIADGYWGLGRNSSFWRSIRARMQRRDSKGRFAEMGGGFSFSRRKSDGSVGRVSGRVVGVNPNNDSTIYVEVRKTSKNEGGVFEIPANKGYASKAIIPQEILDAQGIKAADSISNNAIVVEETEIARVDHPYGWKTVSETPERTVFQSEDGWWVARTSDGDGGAYRYALHRVDDVDDKMKSEPEVADLESWADVQEEAESRREEYDNLLRDRKTRQKDSEASAAKKFETPKSPPLVQKPVDNSPATTTKLGTHVSTPNVLEPGTVAAPDHTPRDQELLERMVAEGPNAVGSQMTANWIQYIAERAASDTADDEAVRALQLLQDGGFNEEFLNLSENDEFLQNLGAGIVFFVESGPQESLTRTMDLGLNIEDYVYTELISQSRMSVKSFYTDMARYYDDPSLLDIEMTPAAAFMRAVAAAPVYDDTLVRYLRFDTPIEDESNPLHQLLSVGQEIDLRPTSWGEESALGDILTSIGTGGATLSGKSEWYDDPSKFVPTSQSRPLPPGEQSFTTYEEFAAAYERLRDSSTGIVLTVRGAQAFDISDLSSIPDEKEHVTTNGRYRVASVEKRPIDTPIKTANGTIDRIAFATFVELEQIKDDDETGVEVEVPDNTESEVIAIGTTVSAPGEGIDTIPSAPMTDDEAYKMMHAEGPNALNSLLTRNWVEHLREFRASGRTETQEMIEAVDAVEELGDGKALRDLSENSAELQNLRAAIYLFTHQGENATELDDSFSKQSELRHIRHLTDVDLIPPDKMTLGSFYTDIARYYNDPSLIDQEMTPAAAFLRAVRMSSVKNEEFARILRFDQPLSDPDNPLHGLLIEGQEFELRPSSWTLASNASNIIGVLWGDTVQQAMDREEQTDTIVILRVNGGEALDLRWVSPHGQEEEFVLANGRYRVVSINEDTEEITSVYGAQTGYIKATTIELELIEDNEDEQPETSEDRPDEETAQEESSVPETVNKPKKKKGKVLGDPAEPGGRDNPIDISSWERIGPQAGSNPGGLFKDADGKKYYIKRSRSVSHADNERLASLLYRRAGIESIDIMIGEKDGELYTVSPIRESVGELGEFADDAEVLEQIRAGFAIDAWLANWDVAGLSFDNIIVTEDRTPIRVDPGGALMWRAQGAPKGNLFGDKVGEIDTLRDSSMNPTSSHVFGDITDEEIIAGVRTISRIRPEEIDKLVDRVVSSAEDRKLISDRLKARRADLMKRYDVDEPPVDDFDDQDTFIDDLPKSPPLPDVSWRGATLRADARGVYVATGLSAGDVAELRAGSLEPPRLPMFIPSAEADPDSGEGYYFAASGKRYWGRYGAAGALVRVKGDDGEYRYLLGRRAGWISSGGGKWGYPGGAHEDLASSLEPEITAFKELHEEVGVEASEVDTVFEDAVEPDWTYTTVVTTLDNADAKISDSETSEIGLFTRQEILDLRERNELMPAIASALDRLFDHIDRADKVADSSSSSSSQLERTPTVASAISTVMTNPNDRFVMSLEDGRDVEDLLVRTTAVRGTDGVIRPIVSFKLSPARAAEMMQEMGKSDGRWRHNGNAGSDEVLIDEDDGTLFSTNIKIGSTVDMGVIEYLYEDPDGRFQIKMAPHINRGTSAVNAVSITFNGEDLDDETVTEAMKIAGVREPRRSENRDVSALIRNRLIRVFGGVAIDEKVSEERAEEILADIRQDLGVGPEDFSVRTMSSGLIEIVGPPELAVRIKSVTGVTGLSHSLRLRTLARGKEAEFLSDLLINSDDEVGVLLSARQRFEIGRQVAGLSSETDMGSSAGEYVYLSQRDVRQTNVLGIDSGNPVIIFNEDEILRRVDIWANKQDEWGSVTRHTDVIGNIGSGFYELMLKHSVSLQHARAIYVPSSYYASLISILRARGVTEINGIPLERFVLEMGSGVLPEGTSQDDFEEVAAVVKARLYELMAKHQQPNLLEYLSSAGLQFSTDEIVSAQVYGMPFIPLLMDAEPGEPIPRKRIIAYRMTGGNIQFYLIRHTGTVQELSDLSLSALDIDKYTPFGDFDNLAYQLSLDDGASLEDMLETIMEKFRSGDIDQYIATRRLMQLLSINMPQQLRKKVEDAMVIVRMNLGSPGLYVEPPPPDPDPLPPGGIG